MGKKLCDLRYFYRKYDAKLFWPMDKKKKNIEQEGFAMGQWGT